MSKDTFSYDGKIFKIKYIFHIPEANIYNILAKIEWSDKTYSFISFKKTLEDKQLMRDYIL